MDDPDQFDLADLTTDTHQELLPKYVNARFTCGRCMHRLTFVRLGYLRHSNVNRSWHAGPCYQNHDHHSIKNQILVDHDEAKPSQTDPLGAPKGPTQTAPEPTDDQSKPSQTDPLGKSEGPSETPLAPTKSPSDPPEPTSYWVSTSPWLAGLALLAFCYFRRR
jgi:hypothetical protein